MIDAMDHILKQEKGKERYLKEVRNYCFKPLHLPFQIQKALEIRDDVGFFQAVRAAIVKNTDTKALQAQDMDTAIKQIISKAIISDRVIDIFAAAGLKKPNISILSDEFLEYVKEMPQKNLAFETLKKLLNDEIKFRQKKNLIQARSFEELLIKPSKPTQTRALKPPKLSSN